MVTTDWRPWCRDADDLRIDATDVVVTLDDGRRQTVRVSEGDGCLELTSTVLRPSAVEAIEDAALRAWRRNRSTRLVGFKVDTRGRLVATAWVPLTGLGGDEFLAMVRRLAREADLFEYQLTGADRE